MNNFNVAIMSHQRPEGLCNRTLKYIYENVKNPNNLNIDVFLSDNEQKKQYVENFNNSWGKKYPDTLKFIVSGNSYLEKVNDIHMAYPIGKHVFVMEDDIDELSKMHIINGKKKYKKITKLDDFLNGGFKECKNRKANIFGIYPVYNSYFSYNTLSEDFRFLIANAFGFISTKDKKLLLECKLKHDYERTIKYMLRDNKVLRYNDVGAKTPGMGKSQGGFDRINKRYKMEKEGCDILLKKYPNMVRMKNCKSDYPEISLIKNFDNPSIKSKKKIYNKKNKSVKK